MAKFIFAYHGGGAPSDPAEQEKAMAAWGAWYGALGDKLLDGGGPAGKSVTVSAAGLADNGGANPLSGYTLVEAPDQAAAAEMAKGCPIVQDGSGSVEVCEIIEM